jgi:hypothetical protein
MVNFDVNDLPALAGRGEGEGDSDMGEILGEFPYTETCQSPSLTMVRSSSIVS